MERLKEFSDALQGKQADDVVRWAVDAFGLGRLAFASSLGLEDQALADVIARVAPRIHVLTVDTGRLFPETRDLIETTRQRYGLDLHVIVPDEGEVGAMTAERGADLFHRSVADRKRCCEVRKVRPMRLALAGRAALLCGLRRGQSVTRAGVSAVEWDAAFGLYKVNPLWDWDLERVEAYVRERRVPVSPLHARDYASIGCACCTRPVRPGEDIRAGRWWWESPETKECGLHGAAGR